MKRIMSLVLLAVFGMVVIGGCHASGHVDDSGAGANVAPNH